MMGECVLFFWDLFIQTDKGFLLYSEKIRATFLTTELNIVYNYAVVIVTYCYVFPKSRRPSKDFPWIFLFYLFEGKVSRIFVGKIIHSDKDLIMSLILKL